MLCDGERPAGCPACGGAGHTELHGCPNRAIPAEVYELARLAAFADRGNLPVAGGLLDQAASFVEGLQRLRADETMWAADRAKRKPTDG